VQLRAVGVDGARGGWVAVVIVGDRVADVWRVANLATVVDRVGAVPFGVDIPIGLLDRPRRAADVAARARLAHTTSSVFPAPCRSVVDAFRAGACARSGWSCPTTSRAATGWRPTTSSTPRSWPGPPRGCTTARGCAAPRGPPQEWDRGRPIAIWTRQ
jgi:hypothetical protein